MLCEVGDLLVIGGLDDSVEDGDDEFIDDEEENSADDGEDSPVDDRLLIWAEFILTILLMELILGTFSASQTLSSSNLSRISQAKMAGEASLYFIIVSTTSGIATLGLDPPVLPAL